MSEKFTPLPISGYKHYDTTPANGTGTYKTTDYEVITFRYLPSQSTPEQQKGWVKIKYRDWDDKTKVLAPDKTEEGILGMQQRFYPIEIPDYTYYGSDPTNSEAVFKNGTLDEVVFYYTKNHPTIKQGKITVEYRDTETDEEINAKDDFKGEVGTSIEINPIYIKGYDYLESQPPLPVDHKVIFSEEETKIVFYYQKIGNPVEKKGKITIKHIDIEDSTKILETETIEWPINKIYKGQEKNFPDYEFIKAEPQNKQIELKNENEEKELLFYYQMKKLIFVSAPHLDFGNHPLSKGHQNYELESLDQPLAVQDFRENGSKWRVELKVTQDFTSRNGRYKLPNAFYYKDNRIDYSLTENVSLPIFEHETTSNQIVKISDAWQANRVGPHLKIRGEQNVLPVAYEAQLTWSLSSVP